MDAIMLAGLPRRVWQLAAGHRHGRQAPCSGCLLGRQQSLQGLAASGDGGHGLRVLLGGNVRYLRVGAVFRALGARICVCVCVRLCACVSARARVSGLLALRVVMRCVCVWGLLPAQLLRLQLLAGEAAQTLSST